jgi:hypothetical protein
VHSKATFAIPAVRKRQRHVPVFLIYAGVIHAIGLALLLPMLITLPGPGGEIATEPAAIYVEIVPGSPLAGETEPEGEQTSALPSAAVVGEEAAAAKSEQETVEPLEPEAEPKQEENGSPREEPEPADQTDPEKATAATAKPSAKPIAAKPAKKTAAVRRAAKPPVRRAGKADKKIAPFNGALTGLFSPGAPAKRR